MGAEYPRPTPRAARTDAWPPSGGPAGSDLDFMRAQLLDAWNIEYGVLNPLLGAGEQLNLRATARRWRSAINDWQIAEWLDPEPRLRASIVVAVRGRRRWRRRRSTGVGDDPRFVQVLLLVAHARAAGPAQVLADLRGGRAPRPADRHPLRRLGRPPDHRRRLAVVLHRGQRRHGARFQAQVISLVCEGVFERFPDAQDRADRGRLRLAAAADVAARPRPGERLRAEVPHLKRPPSEIIARALLGHHPADGGAAAPPSSSSSCSTSSTWTTG